MDLIELLTKHGDLLTDEVRARLVERLTKNNDFPFGAGDKVLIRTVTHIQTGEIVEIIGDFIVLKDSAWIADTGRFNECLKKGVFNEVEPVFVKQAVNMKSIIDVFEFNHSLPREIK